jgi:hypothetical protein
MLQNRGKSCKIYEFSKMADLKNFPPSLQELEELQITRKPYGFLVGLGFCYHQHFLTFLP